MKNKKTKSQSRLLLLAGFCKIGIYVAMTATIIVAWFTQGASMSTFFALLITLVLVFTYLVSAKLYFQRECEILREERFQLVNSKPEPVDLGVTLRTK